MRLDIRRYCVITSAMAARGTGAMHGAKIVRPYKDRVYVYHFVRQTYREDGRVKHRTLANLSHLPPAVIELVRRALAGDPPAPPPAGGRGVPGGSPDELYTALDWLLGRQPAVEAALAARHLGPGSLVLYDVSSTYVTRRACAVAPPRYSRDHRAD